MTSEEEKFMKLVFHAMYLCRKDAGGKTGIEGTIECPKCNGKLHYSISSHNGHLHGNCETKDCLSWV